MPSFVGFSVGPGVKTIQFPLVSELEVTRAFNGHKLLFEHGVKGLSKFVLIENQAINREPQELLLMGSTFIIALKFI